MKKTNWRFTLSSKEVDYPSGHKPFMESKEGFSCRVCEYFSKKENKFKCSNKYYKEWKGDDILDVKDPSKSCSDWFEPKEYKGHSLDPSGGEDSDDGW